MKYQIPRLIITSEEYRNVEEHAEGVILVAINAEQRTSRISKKVCEVLGRPAKEILGKNWFDNFVPERMRKEVRQVFLKLMAGELELLEYFENPVLTSTDEERIIAWHSTVLADEHGRIVGTLSSGTDITERMKVEDALRESEEHYSALVKSLTDAVLKVKGGIVTWCNERAEELYGYGKNELIGLRANSIYSMDNNPTFSKRLSTSIKERGFFRETTKVKRKDGSLIDIDISVSRIPDKSPTEIIAVVRNISEQKRAEEALLKNQEQLEARVKERTAELTRTNEALHIEINERRRAEAKLTELYEQEKELRRQIENEMKQRVEFTRQLAHELKSPLTSLLATSDLLLSKLNEERLLVLAKGINRSITTLNNRIDELLDLAKGEVGMLELRLELVDIRSLLRETVENMVPVAMSQGQSLTVDLPSYIPPVRADEARLQQVLLNLISNAIKFTPRGGKIKLRARQIDTSLTVEVSDTGYGIPKDKQSDIFKPYYRGNQNGRYGGLGLGLTLCKTLIELHGGEIWMKSRVGKGSTFGFTLPYEATFKGDRKPQSVKKLWKVLIIEDDQEIVDAISQAFEWDWPEAQLISTRFGEQGVDLVETENPDIVILDLGLPDTSGFEVLKQIRLFSSVPIIILTVRAEESDIVRGLESGADDYIAKPFRQSELLARLKVQLRKQKMPGEEEPLICGPFRLDPKTSQLRYGEKQIGLTIIEGRIMQHLMMNLGSVVSHTDLSEALWGETYPGAIEALRVHIRRLREKIETDPSHPRIIVTRAGIGYLMEKPR